MADDPLKVYGIDRLDEPALRRAEEAARARLKKTKVFTKEHSDAQERVHTLHRAAEQAHRVRRSKLGKGDPAKLWNTPIKDRHVDYLGAIIQIGMGVPSDAINAIAAGAKPGPGMVDGEMRKTILGGLIALREAGASQVRTKGLKAPFVGGREADGALAEAAGMRGKPLEAVYAAMVRRIARFGPGMRALAWSYREQLWLKDVQGIEKVHALSGAVVSLFVPIGTAVGAAIGGHSAITLAVSRVLSLKAEAEIRRALPRAQEEVASSRNGGAASSRNGAAASSGNGGGVWWFAGLAALGLGGAYLLQNTER